MSTRLTPFARILIVLVILAAVFFGVRKFIPGLTSGGDKPAVENTTGNENPQQNQNNTPNNPPSEEPATNTSSSRTFDFTPPAPVNGKLRGVVELGATGFNSFIILSDAQKNWNLQKAEFGNSLVYENMASDEDVTTGLKKYIGDMLAYGVGPKDIHFVISSGAKKAEGTQKIINGLKKLGYVVNTVTPEQEGKLALKSALPKQYEGSAFVVDVGSGNTKISWLQGGQVSAVEAPGSKYFQNNQTDEQVYRDVLNKVKDVPANKREVCFIIGGVPFELAKQHRNGKERYTVLKAPNEYQADGAKQKAGLNIYNAIVNATGCQEFVFDWDANFTIGFLLNL